MLKQIAVIIIGIIFAWPIVIIIEKMIASLKSGKVKINLKRRDKISVSRKDNPRDYWLLIFVMFSIIVMLTYYTTYFFNKALWAINNHQL